MGSAFDTPLKVILCPSGNVPVKFGIKFHITVPVTGDTLPLVEMTVGMASDEEVPSEATTDTVYGVPGFKLLIVAEVDVPGGKVFAGEGGET